MQQKMGYEIMHMIFVVGTAVLSFATIADAQQTPEQATRNELLKKDMLCVRRAAARLEPSGESPQSIAEAALWVCAAERIAVANDMIQHPPGFDNEPNERGAAIAQVVGVRLCKRTKDCFYGVP